MRRPYGYPHQSDHDETQPFNVDGGYQYSQSYQTDANNSIQSWQQLLGGDTASQKDHSYQDGSSADLSVNHTVNFQFNKDSPCEEVDADVDYETIVRSKNVYNDPQPQIIRKPLQTNPVVYNQKIIIRFLQPPPVEQGPLIIREVRPPQPPPQPPLIIRQRPAPARSPSPLVLRERPPPIPDSLTSQVVTKTLPPLPPPPRTVVIEKLPPLPHKPRDIIIERWIPYESMHKRKVIVQRAEEAKGLPPPKNVIIIYEPIQPRVVRQFERLGVRPEDPNKYSATYGNVLLSTEQLLAQIKELGITVDLTPPHSFVNQQETVFNTDTNVYNSDTATKQRSYVDTNNYAPTYDNLIRGSSSAINYADSNQQQFGHDSQFYLTGTEDSSSQFGAYGISNTMIPH
ncbi:unnamed protein product [Rotaria socialis]|uniref:Uncharacterized protein n=1 Tax=Rotaria socialis TaxID=392032 RepID=A0A820XH66_9BILA|nr:unnamed protein product [Rotaria socialis]CAF4531213.1 unnamed protein product [Rotaria socialis]